MPCIEEGHIPPFKNTLLPLLVETVCFEYVPCNSILTLWLPRAYSHFTKALDFYLFVIVMGWMVDGVCF